jgi:outer membrane protein assembly factor BamB
MHAIDAATGTVVWTFATRARVDSSPVVAGGLTASPAVAAGRVVIGAEDGRLYVFG